MECLKNIPLRGDLLKRKKTIQIRRPLLVVLCTLIRKILPWTNVDKSISLYNAPFQRRWDCSQDFSRGREVSTGCLMYNRDLEKYINKLTGPRS